MSFPPDAIKIINGQLTDPQEPPEFLRVPAPPVPPGHAAGPPEVPAVPPVVPGAAAGHGDGDLLDVEPPMLNIRNPQYRDQYARYAHQRGIFAAANEKGLTVLKSFLDESTLALIRHTATDLKSSWDVLEKQYSPHSGSATLLADYYSNYVTLRMQSTNEYFKPFLVAFYDAAKSAGMLKDISALGSPVVRDDNEDQRLREQLKISVTEVDHLVKVSHAQKALSGHLRATTTADYACLLAEADDLHHQQLADASSRTNALKRHRSDDPTAGYDDSVHKRLCALEAAGGPGSRGMISGRGAGGRFAYSRGGPPRLPSAYAPAAGPYDGAPADPSAISPPPGSCFNCGKPGHHADVCRAPVCGYCHTAGCSWIRCQVRLHGSHFRGGGGRSTFGSAPGAGRTRGRGFHGAYARGFRGEVRPAAADTSSPYSDPAGAVGTPWDLDGPASVPQGTCGYRLEDGWGTGCSAVAPEFEGGEHYSSAAEYYDEGGSYPYYSDCFDA